MEEQTVAMYGVLSLIPPVVAILLCIITRQVVPSLLLGVFSGVFIINHYNPVIALLDTSSKYLVEKSIANPTNAGLIVFCLVIGGMVGVMNRSGGMLAVARGIASRSRSRVSAQIAATILGIVIFIDDYASCMITGNTMRPITDAQRISREKLSFITDATAAAISSVIPVSTWIAMELGLIRSGLESVNINANPLIVFMQTIPYRFYVLYLVIFMFAIFLMQRDYGPMLKAERRSQSTGEVYAKGSHPLYQDDKEIRPEDDVRASVWTAVIPILTFIIVTVVGLWWNGHEEGKNVYESLGNANSAVVLTWASVVGSIVAIAMVIAGRKMSLGKAMDAWIGGVKSMVLAVCILALAFALKAVIDEMGTAQWLVATVSPYLSGGIVPLLVFAICCGLSFATGTSWGTMAIMMPIAIPIAWKVSGSPATLSPEMIATIGAVLGGAIYGDHCSPISDTTILASTASGSDHIAHVNTQLPYATTVAVAGMVFGYIPIGLGLNVWWTLLLGSIALILFVRLVGKKIGQTDSYSISELSPEPNS